MELSAWVLLVPTPAKLSRLRLRGAGEGQIATAGVSVDAGAYDLESGWLFAKLAGNGTMTKTTEGEVIGLFLERPIQRGLSADRTIALIHEQGGLADVPHPFSRNRGRHLRRRALERVAPTLDIVEIFNAREIASSSNVRALEFARRHDLPGGVGSDSHRPIEIGRAYIEVASFTGPQGLLRALREGKVTGTLSGFGIHVRTWLDIARKITRTRVARLRGNAR